MAERGGLIHTMECSHFKIIKALDLARINICYTLKNILSLNNSHHLLFLFMPEVMHSSVALYVNSIMVL